MSLDFSLIENKTVEIFEANITHNLGKMAVEADIYDCLWRPRENGFKKAGDIIAPLAEGLIRLKANPGYYKEFDSKNGWGLYINFVPWVENVLRACVANPESLIEVSV